MENPNLEEYEQIVAQLALLNAELGNICLDGMTPRQREVFLLIGCGLNQKQVGQRLFIEHRTVWSHVSAAKVTRPYSTYAIATAVIIDLILRAMQLIVLSEAASALEARKARQSGESGEN